MTAIMYILMINYIVGTVGACSLAHKNFLNCIVNLIC